MSDENKQATPEILAKVREYQEAVLEYEALDEQIDRLLQAHGGHTDALSDEEYVRYRELAALRDLAHNRMTGLGRLLLDEA